MHGLDVLEQGVPQGAPFADVREEKILAGKLRRVGRDHRFHVAPRASRARPWPAPGTYRLPPIAAWRVLASSMSGLPGSALAISLRYRR